MILRLRNDAEKEACREVYRCINHYYYGDNASHDEIIERAIKQVLNKNKPLN